MTREVMEFLDANKGRYFTTTEISMNLPLISRETVSSCLRRILKREEYEILLIVEGLSFKGIQHYYRAKPETEEEQQWKTMKRVI